MLRNYLLSTLLLIIMPQYTLGQIYPIAFYNLDNLYDTYRDYNILDADFTPSGKYKWTNERYKKKLSNIAQVMHMLGQEKTSIGAVIIGVAEVENKKVLQDLINQKQLNNRNYAIIHSDSPDARGSDVALIYNRDYFNVKSYKTYPYTIPGRNSFKTRDILLVSGQLEDEPLFILINHWISRRSIKSSSLRERAASICKQIVDSIQLVNKDAKIIIMGDFNDTPANKSIQYLVRTSKNQSKLKTPSLFNTMWQLYTQGIGSACYGGRWYLFDQIIISTNLINTNNNQLKHIKSEVFTKPFLLQKQGKYKGYPFRTFSRTTFLGGYSDHLPILAYFMKNKQKY